MKSSEGRRFGKGIGGRGPDEPDTVLAERARSECARLIRERDGIAAVGATPTQALT